MGKKIFILLVVVAICSLILIFLFRFSSTPNPGTPSGISSSLPVSGTRPSETPQGETFPIHTSQGDVVVTNVFKTGQPLQGYNGVLAKRTPLYDILYFADNQYVLITISSRPVLENKAEAEKAFLSLFGITKEEACKLHVSINTTVSVDSELAGKELGLSFCT